MAEARQETMDHPAGGGGRGERLLWSLLMAWIVFSPLPAAGDDVVHRCRNAKGEVLWRNAPCAAGETSVEKRSYDRAESVGSPSCTLYPLCEASSLPLTDLGKTGNYLIEVLINGEVPTRMILDTGASFSTINGTTLAELRTRRMLPPAKEFQRLQATLADGSTSTVPLIRLRSLQLGGTTLRGIETAIYSDPGAPQLLGMNVLNQLKWHLNTQKKVLVIE